VKVRNKPKALLISTVTFQVFKSQEFCECLSHCSLHAKYVMNSASVPLNRNNWRSLIHMSVYSESLEAQIYLLNI